MGFWLVSVYLPFYESMLRTTIQRFEINSPDRRESENTHTEKKNMKLERKKWLTFLQATKRIS